MESLKALLTHPATVRDAIAKQIYEIETPEDQKKHFVKLRDRALGNLLFQEEEVNAMLKIFTALARKLERKAAKISKESAENQTDNAKKTDIIKLLDFPTLNLKYLLIEVGKKLNEQAEAEQTESIYLSVYDQLRQRTAAHPKLISTLCGQLLDFAAYLSTQLDQVRAERKTYQFGKQYKKKEPTL